MYILLKIAQSCPTLCNPMGYTVCGILWARILEWVSFPSPEDLPNSGIKPRSPRLQSDSLPAEAPGKPKNTGVGSLFLLQRIFPTQESNQALLHCKQILYQLNYQGTPITSGSNTKSYGGVTTTLNQQRFVITSQSLLQCAVGHSTHS